jgi:hypothetical protein
MMKQEIHGLLARHINHRQLLILLLYLLPSVRFFLWKLSAVSHFVSCLFAGIRVLNSPEQEIPDPDDDRNWQATYLSSDLEVIIHGIVYYLSSTIRNRDNNMTHEQTPSLRALYEIDSDYAKGCILAKKMLEVF